MKYTDIVFDGPPSHESGRFVEVESPTGTSVKVGEWVQRSDGYWALRIVTARDILADLSALLRVTESDGSQWISAEAFDELRASLSRERAT